MPLGSAEDLSTDLPATLLHALRKDLRPHPALVSPVSRAHGGRGRGTASRALSTRIHGLSTKPGSARAGPFVCKPQTREVGRWPTINPQKSKCDRRQQGILRPRAREAQCEVHVTS